MMLPAIINEMKQGWRLVAASLDCGRAIIMRYVDGVCDSGHLVTWPALPGKCTLLDQWMLSKLLRYFNHGGDMEALVKMLSTLEDAMVNEEEKNLSPSSAPAVQNVFLINECGNLTTVSTADGGYAYLCEDEKPLVVTRDNIEDYKNDGTNDWFEPPEWVDDTPETGCQQISEAEGQT